MESTLKGSSIYKHIALALTLAIAALSTTLCHANTVQLALIISADNSYYHKTAKAISKTLEANKTDTKFNIQTYHIDTFVSVSNQLNKPDLIVAIGTTAATQVIADHKDVPLLNVLIPRQTYLDLIPQLSSSQRKRTSAIYIDQPPSRIIALLQALPLKIGTVAAISGDTKTNDLDTYSTLLAAQGIQFIHTTVEQQQNPIQVLRPLFNKSDAFIALPNNAIFNRAMAKWILTLSFQKKIPVIGFSSAYTNAGALASIFSSPDNIGQQAAETIITYTNSTELPDYKGVYSKYFTLQSNAVIARALGIDLQGIDQKTLINKIERSGHE